MSILKTLLFFIICTCFSGLTAQRQLEIVGNPNSTDTVATILSTYSGQEQVMGLYVESTPFGNALYGTGGYFKGGSRGLVGDSYGGAGVEGVSAFAWGVYGRSTNSIGVNGTSVNSIGVQGLSTNEIGVLGMSVDGTAMSGVSTDGIGVKAESNSTYGIYSESQTGIGVYGKSNSQSGVRGVSASNYGVYGSSSNNSGVYGISDIKGVQGVSTSGVGVSGESINGTAINASSSNGIGIATVSNSNIALKATSTSNFGVFAFSSNATGLIASSSNSYGASVNSVNSHGAYFLGADATPTTKYADIVLGGSNYFSNGDDGVIMLEQTAAAEEGDIFIVSNDAVVIELDSDGGSTGDFEVWDENQNKVFYVQEDGDVYGKSFNIFPSNARLKSNNQKANGNSILEKISQLSILEWRDPETSELYVSPDAEQFNKIFDTGDDNDSISSSTITGLALAAIQELQNEIEILKNEIAKLKKE